MTFFERAGAGTDTPSGSPIFEKVPIGPNRSFRIEEKRRAAFDAPWHFHPEIELKLVVESSGRRFVGDSIEPFSDCDLVLLGPNLPHFWHADSERRNGGGAHWVVIQFSESFLGEDFFRTPEAEPIQRLFERSKRGLAFSGTEVNAVANQLYEATRLRGMASLLRLLGSLDQLARTPSRPLASEAYTPHLNRNSEQRLARVYTYLNLHFREPITLAQIAQVAAMAPEAFSRYFKQATGRNVSTVLNQLRVDCAARALVETSDRVGEIAIAAGFSTLSNFNRRFFEMKHMTPREFRRTFRVAEIEQAGNVNLWRIQQV